VLLHAGHVDVGQGSDRNLHRTRAQIRRAISGNVPVTGTADQDAIDTSQTAPRAAVKAAPRAGEDGTMSHSPGGSTAARAREPLSRPLLH
jgi:hypothetical protein